MDADVAVIGLGPAGIQAAIHAARKKVSVVSIGKIDSSSTYGIKVENYFGLSQTASGIDLLSSGLEQIRSLGVRVLEMNVLSAARNGNGFTITAESGETISAKSVILATGISRVKLNVPGEKEFANGRGVSYCAVCDCNFYKGKTVAVVGSESEAAVSAELMTKYASKVYWISANPKADPSLVSKAESAGAESVRASVAEIRGADRVSSVLLSDGREIQVDGVFIELGGRSSADLAMDLEVYPEVDDTIKVDRSCATQVPGVFACGDITGRPWQIAKAVGEGAVAGLSAADYVRKGSQ
ncbi:Thioredoxin reductase [Thermoplasmatales archaeon BRNA1]|nr:Thioredoxin reductase [Thermoplasmatales archaeon BRNA1]